MVTVIVRDKLRKSCILTNFMNLDEESYNINIKIRTLPAINYFIHNIIFSSSNCLSNSNCQNIWLFLFFIKPSFFIRLHHFYQTQKIILPQKGIDQFQKSIYTGPNCFMTTLPVFEIFMAIGFGWREHEVSKERQLVFLEC